MSETKTALEEIKDIQAQARKISLIEILGQLKEKARQIKENKHYTETILKEMGYDTKDIKSIIDYINSQAKIDEKRIEESVSNELEAKNNKAVEKMKSWNYYTLTSTPSTFNTSYTTTGGLGAVTYCSTNTVSQSDLNLINSL